MRNYLIDFFKTFEYEAEDAAFLLTAWDRIEADPEAVALWQQALELYRQDINCDYTAIRSLACQVADRHQSSCYTLELLVFICMTRDLEANYRSRGLDMGIYHDTVLDLRYKLEECKAVYGVIGSFVAGWFAGFFDLTRFALGRLQFEVIPFEHSYGRNGHVLTPESKVINIHIPRTGTPLTPESCDAAFAMAKAFFRGEVGDPAPFYCSSWLLYPENKTILKEGSNTWRFLMRFDIFESYPDKNRENLWRLFDTNERNPWRLPTDGSFRRGYVEHLKKGGRLGGGRGVFFL